VSCEEGDDAAELEERRERDAHPPYARAVPGFVALITFRVLDPSVGLYAAAAAAVFLVDAVLWRVGVRLFNRERLLTARTTAG
jgi:hypothetical protein